MTGAASPIDDANGPVKISTWTSRPIRATGAQRMCTAVRRSMCPPASHPAMIPIGIAYRMNIGRSAGVAGPSRMSPSWRTWSSTWATMNRSAMAATVISPSRGCRPRRASSDGPSVAQRRSSRSSALAVRSYSSRAGSVRSRSMMASRSGSVEIRPNGTGSSPARMRSISPSQNGPISATWASTSGGPQRASSDASNTSASGHGSPASTAGRVAARAAAPSRSRASRSSSMRASVARRA